MIQITTVYIVITNINNGPIPNMIDPFIKKITPKIAIIMPIAAITIITNLAIDGVINPQNVGIPRKRGG